MAVPNQTMTKDDFILMCMSYYFAIRLDGEESRKAKRTATRLERLAERTNQNLVGAGRRVYETYEHKEGGDADTIEAYTNHIDRIITYGW